MRGGEEWHCGLFVAMATGVQSSSASSHELDCGICVFQESGQAHLRRDIERVPEAEKCWHRSGKCVQDFVQGVEIGGNPHVEGIPGGKGSLQGMGRYASQKGLDASATLDAARPQVVPNEVPLECAADYIAPGSSRKVRDGAVQLLWTIGGRQLGSYDEMWGNNGCMRAAFWGRAHTITVERPFRAHVADGPRRSKCSSYHCNFCFNLENPGGVPSIKWFRSASISV